MSAVCAPVNAATFDLTADELKDAARKLAARMQWRAARWQAQGTPETVIRKVLRSVTKWHSVEMPAHAGLLEVLNRVCDPSWWSRALRKRFRVVEHAAIIAGRVHRHAGHFVSDHAMKRSRRHKRRMEEWLASLIAVNQTTGEMVPLEDLIEQSLANPANSRRAMMARVKGIEQHAKSKGHESLLLTITCPSRMHARHFTGAENERYDGAPPRVAQAHLHQVWRHATRKLSHEGIEPYGLRVVEPHHDGCPHWHILAFVRADQRERLVEVVREYALRESPNEPGAAERRFNVQYIDPAKGSAVGYVAKYIAKNIDGEGVAQDEETGSAGSDSAPRAVTWGGLWGLRQFQFFGVPAITPTRELYRLDDVGTASDGLVAAHQASKGNNYGAWLSACEEYELKFRVVYEDRPSARYAGEFTRRITGLAASAVDLSEPACFTTHPDHWRLVPRKTEASEAECDGSPWTRFNNCAPIDFKGLFEEEWSEGMGGRRADLGRPKKNVPRRSPQPIEGRADWRSSRVEHNESAKLRKNAERPGDGARAA